jgi:hypothetical protein
MQRRESTLRSAAGQPIKGKIGKLSVPIWRGNLRPDVPSSRARVGVAEDRESNCESMQHNDGPR